MGRPNKYPDQFRKDALELVKTSHRPRGVRLRRSPARSGSRRARCGTGSERPVMPTLEPPIQMLCRNPSFEELRRLRRENVELRTDKEILRRAAAYFARETMR